VLTGRAPLGWLIGFVVSFLLVMLLFYSIAYLLVVGVGIWGVSIPVGCGFAIINFVWMFGSRRWGTLLGGHEYYQIVTHRFGAYLEVHDPHLDGLDRGTHHPGVPHAASAADDVGLASRKSGGRGAVPFDPQ
jgi:hypothetical protein